MSIGNEATPETMACKSFKKLKNPGEGYLKDLLFPTVMRKSHMLDVPDNDTLLRLTALAHCFDRRSFPERGALEDFSASVLADADCYRSLQAHVAEAQANGGIVFSQLASEYLVSVHTIRDWVQGRTFPSNLSRAVMFGKTKAVSKQAGNFREPSSALAYLLGYATGKLESQDGFVRELDLHTNDPVIRDTYVDAIETFFNERVHPRHFHIWDYVVDFGSAEFSRHYEDASWDPVAKKQTLPWPNIGTQEEYFAFLKGYFHARWYIPRHGSLPRILQASTSREQTAKGVVHLMHRSGMNPLFTNHELARYQILIDDPADLTDLIDNDCLPPYGRTIAEQNRARKCSFKAGEDLTTAEAKKSILAQRSIIEKYRLAKERVDEMHKEGYPVGTAVRIVADEQSMSMHTLYKWFARRKSVPTPVVRKERLEALAREQPDVALMPYLYREVGTDLDEARILARHCVRAEFGIWNHLLLQPSQTALDLVDMLLSYIGTEGDLSLLRENLSQSHVSLTPSPEIRTEKHERGREQGEQEEDRKAYTPREQAYLRFLLRDARISSQRYAEYLSLGREGLQERLDAEQPLLFRYAGLQVRVRRQALFDYMVYYELAPDQLAEDLRQDGSEEGYFFQEIKGVFEHYDGAFTGMTGSKIFNHEGLQLLMQRDREKQLSLLRLGSHIHPTARPHETPLQTRM